MTTITVESTTTAAQSNVPVTFGQLFKAGALPAANAAVELVSPSGAKIPCQLDVKRTAGGSVRHAILSAIIPALAGSASVEYSIVRAAAPLAGTPAVPANFAGLNATATITDTGTDVAGPTTGTVYTADAAALLAAGTYEAWLLGPVVSEWIVRAPLKTAEGIEHPDLHARFAIRAYKGQAKAEIDFIIENTWAKKRATPLNGSPWENVSVEPRIYRASFKAGTSTVYTRSVKGYTIARLTFNSNGTYDNNATGVPNDSTVYKATITVDGVAKAISVAGSAIQTFGQLFAQLTTQLGGIATVGRDPSNLGVMVKSLTTGPTSRVVISGGTLFPALKQSPIYRPIYGDERIHRARTRFLKTFWWGGAAPSVHIRHNKQYLDATRGIPHYDPALTGSSTTIAGWKTTMAASEAGDPGVSKANWADTGYAPNIGLLPAWGAMYAVNHGKDAKDVMLGMAELGSDWAMYVRDYETDAPLSFNRWPYATNSPNAGDSRNPATGLNEKLPSVVVVPSVVPSLLTAEVAHHPDFYFVPYMVTGKHFYMESLAFQQRFVTLNFNPHATYRDGKKSLWKVEECRGQAWSMRTTCHAGYILPDTYPLRAEMDYIIEQNAIWYQDNYISPGAKYHNPFGMVYANGLLYTVKGQPNTGFSPWMDDHLTSAAGRAVELGYDVMKPFLDFKAKVSVGRLTSGPSVYCWQQAVIYALRLRETSASPLYTTWGEIYQGTVQDSIKATQCGSMEMALAMNAADASAPKAINNFLGYPADIGGFAANLQPAVAYSATFNEPDAADAYLVFEGRATKPDYNAGPQFAIVPYTTEAAPTDPADPTPTPPTTETNTMAIADSVKDSSTSTGTGNMVLNGAPENTYQTWYPAIPIGERTPYTIRHRTLHEKESGWGHISSSLVFVRDEVTSSTNGDQRVNFSAGVKDISVDFTAAQFKEMAGKHNVVVSTLPATTSDTLLLAEVGGVLQKIALDDAGMTVDQLALLPGGALQDTDKVVVTRAGVDYYAPRSYFGSGTPADGTAPQFLSGQVSNATPTIILLTFNETLGPYTPAASAFSVSGGKTVSAVSRNGASLSLTVNSAYVYGDVVSVTYTKPTTNPIQDPTGNQTVSFGPTGVVNNIAAPGDNIVPTISAANVANSTPTIVTLTASEPLDGNFVPAASAFTVSGHTVSSVAISGSTISLAVSAAFVNGEAARTAAYTQPGTNNVRDLAGNLLANFTGQAITNNVAATATAPGAPTIGTAVAGDGYIDVAFTAPASNGGSAILDYTATLSTGQTATGTASPIRVTAPNGTAATATVKARNTVGTGPASAASNSVTPAAAVVHTIAPFVAGNTPKTTITRAEATAQGTTLVGFLAEAPFTAASNGVYWTINPTPTSARCGWGLSNTTRPPDITLQQNVAGDNSVNGMQPMGHPNTNWANENRLWAPKGAPSGPYYFWIEGEGGVAQCKNAGAGLMVT